MNKKTDEKKKKEELRKFFQKAVSLEADGKLSKDQWRLPKQSLLSRIKDKIKPATSLDREHINEATVGA